MTQAISVYISKAISGPKYSKIVIELEATEVHDWRKTTIWIYGIKLLQLEYLMSFICSCIQQRTYSDRHFNNKLVIQNTFILYFIAMVKLKSFNIPVMSSWKYAGACLSPKGTLIYPYFPNGEVKAVLGMDAASKGIWLYPAWRSSVEKYFALFNWEKISSTLGTGQMNFLATLLSVWQSITKHLPLSPLGATIMGADHWISILISLLL